MGKKKFTVKECCMEEEVEYFCSGCHAHNAECAMCNSIDEVEFCINKGKFHLCDRCFTKLQDLHLLGGSRCRRGKDND